MSISLPSLWKSIAFALVPHSLSHSASDLDHNLEAHFYKLPGEITYSCSLHTCPWSPIIQACTSKIYSLARTTKACGKMLPGQWYAIRATSCSRCHFVAKHQHKLTPLWKASQPKYAFHNNVFKLTQWAWNINIQQLNPNVLALLR